MGYSTDSRGIRSFWPDDDKDTLHLQSFGGLSFDYIKEKMQQHFGACMEMEDFSIDADRIHTDCIGYDLYDPSDYTNFLIITRNKS